MAFFDDIVAQGPQAAPQSPPQSPPQSGGMFGDILSGEPAPAAPAAPAEPASFTQRYTGDPAAVRAGMRPGLEQHAETTMGMPSRGEAAVLGAARGNLMEFADEAAAGVNAGIDAIGGQPFGESYDRHLEH